MKVLIVEDDLAIADAIKRSLEKTEFRADHVTHLSDAQRALADFDVELIVLDLGLPDGDGMRFVKSLRQDGCDFPVIILTARDRVNDRVLGLNNGADDYLAKPFEMPELIARLRALKRRRSGRAENSIPYDRLVLKPDQMAAFLDGATVPLPVSQFRLLQYLLEQQGRVRTKQQIIDALYLWDHDVEENTIEVYISQLRKYLWNDLIKTVRGIGYCIPTLNQNQ